MCLFVSRWSPSELARWLVTCLPVGSTSCWDGPRRMCGRTALRSMPPVFSATVHGPASRVNTRGTRRGDTLSRTPPCKMAHINSGWMDGGLTASPCAFSPTPCCRLNRCCDQGIQASAATMSFSASGVALILSLSFAFASAALVQPRNLSTLVVCGEIASAISSASDVFYPCRYYRYVLLELMLTAVLDDLLGVQWNLTTQRTTTTGHSRAPSYPSVQ